jgi:hypothetical protein
MRIRSFSVRFLIASFWLFPTLAGAAPGCPPAGWNAERLHELKERDFVVEDSGARQKLALGLLACLADADPTLRDGVAFEAYSTWLRADKLDAKTRLAAEQTLLSALDPKAVDSEGFRQPFSALVLSELARADRKSPYLTPAQRQQLVEAAARYVESVRDYRGFDQREGWRHGVAHGSDLLMQLALNENLDKAQLDRILAAVKVQIAPVGEHFYVYGESERLARPVLFVALRGLHSTEEWSAWFQQVASPAPLPAWDQAFQSNAGLARRHNTQAFLRVAYVEVTHSKKEELTKLLPAVTAALEAVP